MFHLVSFCPSRLAYQLAHKRVQSGITWNQEESTCSRRRLASAAPGMIHGDSEHYCGWPATPMADSYNTIPDDCGVLHFCLHRPAKSDMPRRQRPPLPLDFTEARRTSIDSHRDRRRPHPRLMSSSQDCPLVRSNASFTLSTHAENPGDSRPQFPRASLFRICVPCSDTYFAPNRTALDPDQPFERYDPQNVGEVLATPLGRSSRQMCPSRTAWATAFCTVRTHTPASAAICPTLRSQIP